MPRYTVGNRTVTSQEPLTDQELDELFADVSEGSSPNTPQKNELVDSMSLPEKMLVATGKGMSDIASGIQQIFGLKSAEDIAEERKIYEPLQKSGGIPVRVAEMIGGILPTMTIPGGVQGNILMRMLTAAGAGATIGALQPTTPDESRLKNISQGAILGGGTSGLLGMGGKIANLFTKKLPPTEASKYGISTTLGEDTGNIILKHGETQLEQIPLIGLQGFRKKQQAEAEQAVKGFFGQYVVNPTLDATSAMKQANDDYINVLYETMKQSAKALPSIHPANTKQKVSELLDQFPTIFESIQDQNVKNILRNIAGDTKDKTIKTGVLNAQGQPISRTQQVQTDFNDLWKLRQGLGKESADAGTDTAKWFFNELKASVADDMDTMFNTPGSIVGQEFKAANDAFRQYSVKFDALRQAYDMAMGTTKAGEMFSPKRFATALKNLANDPTYKKNVRWSQNEIQEMTGLANVLQTVKRAGEFAENPPTGFRYGLLSVLTGLGAAGGVAGGTAGGLGAVAGAGTIAAITTFMTTTKIGKKIALTASKIEPTDPRMAKIMDEVYNQLPKAATTNVMQAKRVPYFTVTPNPTLSGE